MFDHRSFFERLPVRSYAVAPERIVGSAYNRAHCIGASPILTARSSSCSA
jgi:hypothetical protein